MQDTVWAEDGNLQVAKISELPWINGKSNWVQEVANARLIAAAPELLAACQYVVKWHREHDSGEGELYGLDFVTTCIGAIAKAKGATP